jgi:ABC-type Fe3+/spermidine/putrescine transport system ATPase subunit
MELNNDFLKIDAISKSINGSLAVDDVSLSFTTQKKIAIIGETGSGKSTLLKLIGGLEQLDAGSIWYNQIKIKGALEQLIPGHPKIAYLSQHFELPNNYQVFDVLDFINQLSEIEKERLYDICGIRPFLQRWTDELSGGERQRVALVKTLLTAPELLLLDEPFSNLDLYNKQNMTDLINSISIELNVRIIMVSHDATDVMAWAEEIYILKNGKIIQSGTPEFLYHYPITEYCANLLGDCLFVENSIFPFISSHLKLDYNKKIFLRPSYFSVAENRVEDSITGKITKIVFKGNYSVLHVLSNVNLFHILSIESSKHQVGKEIAFYFNRENIHYI